MYSTDLHLQTRARLQETQNVALALLPIRHHLPRWMRRAAAQALRGMAERLDR